ncbi:hypothetical protein EDD16DRAFT_1526720 [Pisolithus croceorrhizus]|nr:hypothetical protein EDD16DRAFT_1526720 [Pisolithus croceorrhizus]KAI6166503.1 hypothetical protein EDD17DRAFT_1504925 [Pisolithus thermaeus]
MASGLSTIQMGLQAILMEHLKMVPYTNGTHTSQNPFSPCALAFHLTPNSKPTLPLICLKKPGSISSGHVNVESECGYLTIGNNVGSDQDECSDDNNNDDNDNDDNSSGNNSDAPALTCTTLHAMEQSGLDARVFKKGSSNSFKPVVRVFNHSLTHKVPSMEQPSQQVQKPGPSQNWASGAPSHIQGHSHHAVEADEENFESELSELCHKPQQKAHKFCNQDLLGLPYTMALFCNIVLPHWIFYFSLLGSPWKLANPLHVAYIQKLWAETFPNIKCMVALCNNPIFALACPLAFYLVTILIISEVKQHTYDWHSELATHALKAAKVFFDWYEEVDTTEAQAAYVAWAVPEVTEIVDAHGCMKPVASSLFPYMWERVEEGPDGPVTF